MSVRVFIRKHLSFYIKSFWKKR